MQFVQGFPSSQKVLGVCLDLNRTAQHFQMAVQKSFKTISYIILNRLQPKIAAKTVANEAISGRDVKTFIGIHT